MNPKIITFSKFKDNRGIFSVLFEDKNFKQVNSSMSYPGTVRGLHCQIDPWQEKTVYCLTGAILDVAIDIRLDSKDFGKIYYFNISEDRNEAVFIPSGFLHGFSVQSNTTSTIIYGMSDMYNSNFERGINPICPNLNIDWNVKDLIISDKDKNLPYFSRKIIEQFYGSSTS